MIDEGLYISQELAEPLKHLFSHPLSLGVLEIQNCKQGLMYVLGIS